MVSVIKYLALLWFLSVGKLWLLFYKGCGPSTCHCLLLAYTAVFQMKSQLLTKSIVLPLPFALVCELEQNYQTVSLPLCWEDTGQIAQNFFFKFTLSSNSLMRICLLYTGLCQLCSKQILTEIMNYFKKKSHISEVFNFRLLLRGGG